MQVGLNIKTPRTQSNKKQSTNFGQANPKLVATYITPNGAQSLADRVAFDLPLKSDAKDSILEAIKKVKNGAAKKDLEWAAKKLGLKKETA